MIDGMPDPDYAGTEVKNRVQAIFDGLPDPAEFAAGIEELRRRPDSKGEYALAMEHLSADLSVVLASIDDVKEYQEKGNRQDGLIAMMVFNRYVATLEQDRRTMLIYRLTELLWTELVAKCGGDRQVMMDKLTSNSPGVFASLPRYEDKDRL